MSPEVPRFTPGTEPKLYLKLYNKELGIITPEDETYVADTLRDPSKAGPFLDAYARDIRVLTLESPLSAAGLKSAFRALTNNVVAAASNLASYEPPSKIGLAEHENVRELVSGVRTAVGLPSFSVSALRYYLGMHTMLKDAVSRLEEQGTFAAPGHVPDTIRQLTTANIAILGTAETREKATRIKPLLFYAGNLAAAHSALRRMPADSSDEVYP
jgi:hypothetical protein